MKHRPEQILDAAVDVFDRDGVQVSTARVASAAGVSNGTLFNYFPTKQDLIDGVYRHTKSGLIDALSLARDESLPLADRLRAQWIAWIRWGQANPANQRVSALLRNSGLVGGATLAEFDAALSGLVGDLTAAAERGDLVDLPLSHLMAIGEATMTLAIADGLDAAQQQTSFDVFWRGITKPS